MPLAVPPYKRFEKYASKIDGNGCTLWTGPISRTGYGQLKAWGKQVSAHRFAYELHKGPIPSGLEVLHQCDVKACVNPDHLTVGTHAENMAEAGKRGQMLRGDDHPMRKHGHPRKGIKSKQSIPVFVKGRKYGSINESENALNLGHGTVRYWMNKKPHFAKTISREEYYNA